MIGIVLGFATYLLEIIKLFSVMFFLLHFEMKSRRCTFFCVLLFMIPAGILGALGYMAVAVYLSILVTLLVFRGKRKILYGLMSVFAISCFDSLCISITLLLLGLQYTTLRENAFTLLGANAISLLVLPLLIWGGSTWQKKRVIATGRETGRKWLIFVLIGEMALSFFVQSFQVVVEENVRYGNMMAVALCIGSVVFIMVMVFFLMSITTRGYYQEFAEMNVRILHSQTEYYEMLLEKEEETRAFRHDIRSHFYCMHLLFEKGEMEELNEYFNKVGAVIEELKLEVQTSNRMVDMIISNIVGKYPTVKCVTEGKMWERTGLDNHDLCTIFFNLLENAFAAAEKSKEKQVIISFFEQEEMKFCRIENTVIRHVEIRNNRIQTEKEDKRYHGYGTLNAVKCVERNGGELRFSCENNLFKAEIILFV